MLRAVILGFFLFSFGVQWVTNGLGAICFYCSSLVSSFIMMKRGYLWRVILLLEGSVLVLSIPI